MEAYLCDDLNHGGASKQTNASSTTKHTMHTPRPSPPPPRTPLVPRTLHHYSRRSSITRTARRCVWAAKRRKMLWGRRRTQHVRTYPTAAQFVHAIEGWWGGLYPHNHRKWSKPLFGVRMVYTEPLMVATRGVFLAWLLQDRTQTKGILMARHL